MNQDLMEQTVNSETNLIFPPQSLNNLSAQQPQQYPDIISYEQHPAYSELIKSATLKTRIMSLLRFGKYFLIVSIKRVICYELIPAHLRKPKSFSSLVGFFKAIFINNQNKLKSRNTITPGKDGGQIFEKLDAQGICVVDLNSNHFDRIDRFSLPLIERLRNFRAQKAKESREFAESRSTVLRPDNIELFQAVETSFTESGILEGIAQYLGRPVRVIDINPQINDKSDDFWRHIFSDTNIESPSSSYCHRDASGGDVKVILYLNDVTKDTGPFSFILGSHKNRPDWKTNLIQEVNDSCGFSSPAYEARKSFAALPAFLRKKCAFGNDLQSESKVAKQLMAAEWKITGSKGHAVIFDSKGIHRGGMVIDNERIVITCVIG